MTLFAPGEEIVDVNVWWGPWPTRRCYGDVPEELTRKLQGTGIREAWVGSVDGLFQADLTGVNDRLAAGCGEVSTVRLVPFGMIDPSRAGWERELDRCQETHGMPGIRLSPDYHGYGLKQSEFARVLAAAAERGLIVSFAAQMEDARMMHPRLRVPVMSLEPLVEVVEKTPGLKLVLLNALRRSVSGTLLDRLMKAGEVYLETGMLEGMGGIEVELKNMPVERMLFGSYFPYFYLESGLLKLRESELGHHQRRLITRDNARRLLPLQAISRVSPARIGTGEKVTP